MFQPFNHILLNHVCSAFPLPTADDQPFVENRSLRKLMTLERAFKIAQIDYPVSHIMEDENVHINYQPL